MGREYAMEAGQMDSWFGYQSSQSGNEIQGLKQDVGGVIAVEIESQLKLKLGSGKVGRPRKENKLDPTPITQALIEKRTLSASQCQQVLRSAM